MDSDEDSITLFGHMPILSLLVHCIRQLGSTGGTNDPSDPAHEVALVVIVNLLECDRGDPFEAEFPLIPRRRHPSLLTAARTALDQSRARQSSQTAANPAASPPPALDRSRQGLSDDWKYEGKSCPALGPHPIPVHYWLDQLIPELNGQGITDGVHQGQVMRRLLHD